MKNQKNRTMIRKFVSGAKTSETHVWEEVDETGKTRRYCRGYASTFGTLDTDGEIIGRTAWDETIASGRPVRFIRGHNHSGGACGVFKSFEITEKGLYFVAEIIGTAEGKDLFIELEAGALDSFSVGFYVAEKRLRTAAELKAEGVNTAGYADDAEIVEFTKAELFEVSAVLFPANAGATIGAKMSNRKRGKTGAGAIRRPQATKAELAPGAWVSWHYEDGDLAFGVVAEVMASDVTLDDGDVMELVEGDPLLRIDVMNVSADGGYEAAGESVYAYASQVTPAEEPTAGSDDDEADKAAKAAKAEGDLAGFLSGLRDLCTSLLGDAAELEAAKAGETLDSILKRLR